VLLKEYAAILNRLVAVGHGNKAVCTAGKGGMHEVTAIPVVERGEFQKYDPTDLAPLGDPKEGEYISLNG
jgi:hypothetical protein